MNEQEQFRLYGQVVAKAWSDPAFKAQLQADPAGTLRTEGFTVSSGTSVRVLEPDAQHLFLPLFSGAQPAAQDDLFGHLAQRAETDPAFKQRLLADPAAVLAEQGVTIPDGVAIEVIDGDDSQGYIMIPPKPDAITGDASGDDVAGYFSCCLPPAPPPPLTAPPLLPHTLPSRTFTSNAPLGSVLRLK